MSCIRGFVAICLLDEKCLLGPIFHSTYGDWRVCIQESRLPDEEGQAIPFPVRVAAPGCTFGAVKLEGHHVCEAFKRESAPHPKDSEALRRRVPSIVLRLARLGRVRTRATVLCLYCPRREHHFRAHRQEDRRRLFQAARQPI